MTITMTREEFQADMDRENGRADLYYHARINVHVTDVLDYTIKNGARVAVVTTARPDGTPYPGTATVPLASMFAARPVPALGMNPVPWC